MCLFRCPLLGSSSSGVRANGISSRYALCVMRCAGNARAGCAKSGAAPGETAILAEPNSFAPYVDHSLDTERRSAPVQEHDFGVVLAEGQTLRHEFTLKNSTDRPLRIIRGTAFTPCCSALEPMPESLPPNSEAKITAVLTPGYQSGLKGVRFSVETDDEKQPVRAFTLRGRFLSGWEVERLDGSATSLLLGQSATQTFRITVRRASGQGPGLPETVLGTPPITAAFNGDGSTKNSAEGFTEAVRDVLVTILSGGHPGPQRADVHFGWPGQPSRRHTVTWEVRPRLKVSPSGFVLKTSPRPIKKTVVVISDGHPFRVKRIVGPVLAGEAELPRDAATTQELALNFDASQSLGKGAADVTIETDHPDQRSVSVSVLVLPETKPSGEGQ